MAFVHLVLELAGVAFLCAIGAVAILMLLVRWKVEHLQTYVVPEQELPTGHVAGDHIRQSAAKLIV
jgi:hypothetical protein